MIKKYILFFTPMCPNCPKVKEFMKDKELEKEWIDASTPDGLGKAREMKVVGVPTVIFLDEKGKEVTRAASVEEVKRVIGNQQLTD